MLTDFLQLMALSSRLKALYQNAIKVPHWYAVQVSDTTMLPRATSSFGQKITGYKKSSLNKKVCDCGIQNKI